MFKLYKIVLKATIGYFYDIISTRISKMFILSKRRIIYLKDVRFNDTKFYHFLDLNIGVLQIKEITKIIKLINIWDEMADRQKNLEEYNNHYVRRSNSILKKV